MSACGKCGTTMVHGYVQEPVFDRTKDADESARAYIRDRKVVAYNERQARYCPSCRARREAEEAATASRKKG